MLAKWLFPKGNLARKWHRNLHIEATSVQPLTALKPLS